MRQGHWAAGMNLLRRMSLRQDGVVWRPDWKPVGPVCFHLWVRLWGHFGLDDQSLMYKRRTNFITQLISSQLQSPTHPSKHPIPTTSSNMPSPVESGQEIMVPLFNAETAGAPVHVNWQQNLSQRKADYYVLTADNLSTG